MAKRRRRGRSYHSPVDRWCSPSAPSGRYQGAVWLLSGFFVPVAAIVNCGRCQACKDSPARDISSLGVASMREAVSRDFASPKYTPHPRQPHEAALVGGTMTRSCTAYMLHEEETDWRVRKSIEGPASEGLHSSTTSKGGHV